MTQILDAHAWTLCSGSNVGNVRLEVLPHTDTRRLMISAKGMLAQVSSELSLYLVIQ